MGRRHGSKLHDGRQQHGKQRKRPRGWHRGRATGQRFERLPEILKRPG